MDRRQLLLARGICEYDSALAGLRAAHTAAAQLDPPLEGRRAVVTVPMGTIMRLRTELRLLLDRWDADYPLSVRTVGHIDSSDLDLRAGHVRAWLTLHIEELDALREQGGDER